MKPHNRVKLLVCGINFAPEPTGISPNTDKAIIHLSARDDSSSLLPISGLQTQYFPGTEEVGVVSVNVTMLEKIINENDISGASLLKQSFRDLSYKR